MSKTRYLIIHKDHLLSVRGINSGAEMATLCLARFLAQAGRSVVVAGQLDGPECSDSGVEFWNLGPTFDVAAVLNRAAEQSEFHLISAGRALPILVSKDIQNCLSRTLISHDRAGNDTGIKPEVLCNVADRIVCVSHAQREVFLQSGADPRRVVVVHNGVDLNLFQHNTSQPRDWQKIVFVGALVRDKGLHVLLEAYAKLKSKYQNLSLDIYGSAKLWGREEYLNEAAIANQLPGVTFLGQQSQSRVAQGLQLAGLCVIPSIWFDPFPLTALEAQATGCPVVAFDVGGLKEGIQDGETGIVVKDVSLDALVKALDEQLSNPSRLASMSLKAAAHIRAHFTWERVANDIIALCEQQLRIPQKSLALPKEAKSAIDISKIALVTTWNQECGLATYAKYLLSSFPDNSIRVFAEDVPEAQRDHDEPYVERCWRRNVSDYSAFERAIEKHDIQLLHLNFHDHNFIPRQEFRDCLQRLRQRGVRIISHFHTTYSYSAECVAFLNCLDGAIVHTPENRMQLVAQGADADSIHVLPHGVHCQNSLSAPEKLALRKKHGIPETSKIIVSAGFVQPNKGMEGVIAGVAALQQRGVASHGYIIGKVNSSHPQAQEYYEKLKALAKSAGVERQVQFVGSFLSDQELYEYLQLADLVMMNYQSPYYEASGACALAVGSGAVVATSLSPVFNSFSDAVWHMTAGFPPSDSAVLLLQNETLRETLRQNARRYSLANSWQQIFGKLERIYRQFLQNSPSQKEHVVEQEKNGLFRGRNSSALRILIQNRPNTFTQRGGDTVVIERLVERLKDSGVEVKVDVSAREDPSQYDVVHLFNFALPDFTRTLAQRAHQAGVPFVVTTLLEDVSQFHNQSHGLAALLMEYERLGQDRAWWYQHMAQLAQIRPSENFNNSWTAQHASALFTNGSRESATLRSTYKQLAPIVEIKLGHEAGPGAALTANPDAFVKEYGVKDFIFCVGRLESRKNQLMLLKALEDSELPVVLAAGGFSYQPDYEQAVRRFRRRGPTVVLGRLTPETLCNAYAAARIHVLPSWYELPGLVSLEAAHYGKNVVVTKNGTAQDYLGDHAFYCNPADEFSIVNAVLSAYHAPVNPELKALVDGYTWDRTAQQTLDAYRQVARTSSSISVPNVETTSKAQPQQFTARESNTVKDSGAPVVGYDLAPQVNEFQELLDKGEMAARNKEFNKGHELLEKAERLDSRSARVLRTRAAIFLAESNVPKANEYFSRALEVSPLDARALSGLGMCRMMDQRTNDAYDFFVRALEQEPDQLTAMMQLVDCSYRLQRFDDLERALRRYCDKMPDDLEMKYCLAGCLYKLGRRSESETLAKAVAARNPTHLGTKQLLDLLREESTKAAANVQTVPAPQVSKTPAQAMPGLAGGSLLAAYNSTKQNSTPQPSIVATSVELKVKQQSEIPALSIPKVELNNSIVGMKNVGVIAQSAASVSTKLQEALSALSQLTVEVPKAFDKSAANQSNSVEAMRPIPSIPQSVGAWSEFDQIDQKIIELEELKRKRELKDLAAGIESLTRNPQVKPGQQNKLDCLKAEVLILEDKLEQAMGIYETVLARDPKNARALCGQGALRANNNQWELAKQCFSRALESEPAYDVALAGLGLCAWWDKDNESAWKYYERALAQNPENARALLGIIQLGYPLRRFQSIEQAIRGYLEFHPLDLEFVYSLAGVYFAQDKLREAAEEVQKILMFEPKHARALELSQMIQQKQQVTPAFASAHP